MTRCIRVAGILALVIVALLLGSCTKLTSTKVTPGGIPVETLATHDVVPAEWGNLVSVSSVTEFPDLAQLWFQDGDGNVRYVVVSLRSHELLNAHVIRRK
jgi:hypothetical protein